MQDEILLRSFIARTVGTLEGILQALEITKNPMAKELNYLLHPLVEEGHKLLPGYGAQETQE